VKRQFGGCVPLRSGHNYLMTNAKQFLTRFLFSPLAWPWLVAVLHCINYLMVNR